jgi:hypothetical protein
VDGPDGIAVPCWPVMIRANRGAVHDEHYHDRFGPCEECFSAARGGWGGQGGDAAPAASGTGRAFLRRAWAVCGGDGGLRRCPSLGSDVAAAGARGTPDAGAIREALRQAQQDRRPRRGGDLRGDEPADDALREREERGCPGGVGDAPHAGAAGAPAHHGGECVASDAGGVRDRGGARQCGSAHADGAGGLAGVPAPGAGASGVVVVGSAMGASGYGGARARPGGSRGWRGSRRQRKE